MPFSLKILCSGFQDNFPFFIVIYFENKGKLSINSARDRKKERGRHKTESV